MTSLARSGLFLVMLLSLSLSACVVREYAQPGSETTVVLIRHAERTTVTKVLTEAGQQRAQALVDAIGDMPIHAIYSPNLVRNIDTVRPLAQAKGVEIQTVDNPDVDQVTRLLLRDHAGQTVLWVGNTTNLTGIYTLLGGTGDPPDNYGDLFVLTVREAGDTRVDKRHFGR